MGKVMALIPIAKSIKVETKVKEQEESLNLANQANVDSELFELQDRIVFTY